MALNLKSEYKYICDDIEKLKKIMQEEGFIFKESIKIHDDYLIDINENMILNDSCVRIRNQNNNQLYLTFESEKDILSRIDLNIFDKVKLNMSEYNDILSLMASLGYFKYIGLDILKETYIKKEREYYYTINIDHIENIGAMVDFDIYTESENEEEIEKRFENFKATMLEVMKNYTNLRYRDYCSIYLYENYYKGKYLKKILVELDKIFVNINFQKLEESIRNKYTILNLELIEKIEQLGIDVNIVYSSINDNDVREIKRILSSIGYNPKFINIKEIKEIAVKETLIIEKQKKQEFSEFILSITRNIEK